MPGWSIHHRAGGGLVLMRLDPDTGNDEIVVVDPAATVDDLWSYVVATGEIGDWCVGPDDHGVMLVGFAEDVDAGG